MLFAELPGPQFDISTNFYKVANGVFIESSSIHVIFETDSMEFVAFEAVDSS